MTERKKFVAYFYCNGADLSFGVTLCFTQPNLEIHLPFGFIRIGWEVPCVSPGERLGYRLLYRSFGITGSNQ